MKTFWMGFWLFLTFMVVMAIAMRPDVVDGILLYTGAYLAVVGWALVALVVILPVGLVVGGLAFLWMALDKRRNESRRQRDGSYPILEIDPRKPKVFFDPNQMVGSASAWVPGVGWVEYDGGAGWENQRQIAAMRSYVSRVQAATPGDKAIADSAHELRNTPGAGGMLNRLGNIQAAKWAERNPKEWGKEPPAARPVPAPAAPAALPAPAQPEAQPLSLRDAVHESQPARVVFGWQPQTGDLAMWDLAETPHMRLHGGTQKGKTSAAMGIVAALLAHGAQVAVLDPRGGKNWGIAAEDAEVLDVRNPEAFVRGLRCVHDEYVRRDAILAQEGAKDILALRRTRLHRLVVVVEEYGAQRVRAQAAGALAEVDNLLSIITSEAAASGVHVIAVDTRPTEYHPFVKANLGAVVVFNLPDGAGKAAGFARAHMLQRFQFWFDGDIYQSVDARQFEAVVRSVGPVRYPPVLAQRAVSQSVSVNAFQGVSPEVDVSQTGTGNAGNTEGGDMGKWYEYILDYMSRPEGAGLWKTPAEGVRVLARAMSATETGSEAAENSYVSIASKVSRRIRENARLETGERLGTDITGGA